MKVNNTKDSTISTIKVNSKKSDMKNKKEKIIFDSVDINNDGIISQSEYKGVVKGKTRGKNGTIIVRDYIKVKDLNNGRSLVVDENGKQWIMSHDGNILKATYVAVQTAKENLQKAKRSFKKQKDKEGWAGKTADAISVLWNSKNRASVVSEDLEKHFQLLQQLFKSEKAGSEAFNRKFKEIFGVNYNETAVTKYLTDPTEENYRKAFGNKNNIQDRVTNYNQSQELGASVVKTSAAVAGTVALGIATGGTSLVATAAISAGTSLAVNASDRISSEDGLTGEDTGTILKEAVLDGVTVGAAGKVAKLSNALIKGVGTSAKIARGSINTAGDIIIGAGQEYIETGNVSASGALLNAAPGAIGIAAETGILRKTGRAVKKALSGSNNSGNTINNLTDLDGNVISGGWFSEIFNKSVSLDAKKGWQNFKTANGEITLLVDGNKVYYGKVGDLHTKILKIGPNESKLLGQTSDGKSIILTCDSNGKYTVKYTKSINNPSVTQTTSTSTNHPLKSGITKKTTRKTEQKIQTNISKANKNSDNPGSAVISDKLKLATNNPGSIKEFESNFDLDNISQKVANGDVCAVGSGSSQKLYVNNNGTAVELKISKEKFEELFPPSGFALVEQNGYNNCWLVSRLNSMTESSYGRSQLYSLLEETPSGDIIVKLKNAKPIIFPGGKPAAAMQTSLGEGASPGLEMIEQAVLIRYLKEPSERVNDISKLNLSSLNDEANALAHSDFEATASLLGRTGKQINNSNTNYETELRTALEQFNSGNDMAVATWGMHARSIVSYNKNSGMVTYHDPYYAGVDLVCSFDDFIKKQPNISLCKAQNSTPLKKTSTISKLSIPDGYREYTPDSSGNRRVIGPKNQILVEKNGKWFRVI